MICFQYGLFNITCSLSLNKAFPWLPINVLSKKMQLMAEFSFRQYNFEKEVSDSVLFFENTSHCLVNLVHEE